MSREQRSTDANLVAAAARGDRRACETIYERHVHLVNAAVLSRVPPSDAPDIVQEVFAAAFRRLDTVRDHDKLSGFLLGIARRQTAGYWRRKRPTEPLGEETAMPGHADDKTLANQVLRHIRELPEAYRLPLVLRLVEDMTGPEIAETTGLTPGSVRVNLHRGMKLLRASLNLEPTDD